MKIEFCSPATKKEYPSASKVIAALQSLIDKHGDLPLLLRDPDTCYQQQIGLVHRMPNNNYCKDSEIECFEFTGGYGEKPEGFIAP